MEQYQKGPNIGEGTYGTVLCATHIATGRTVALKKVKMRTNKDGIGMSVLRELKALKALKSPHIVDLLDVFTTKSSLVLVFEYMDWSLEDVIRDKGTTLAAADVKAYMQMLLEALAHVHSNQTLHRDIKPDNMLIGCNGVMKLADFGLARSLDPTSESSSRMTPQVFGRWYRPPELLMGCSNYGFAVDMWAAGCVLAEMLLRRPWFPATCDMDQLDRIFKALGVPTLQTWPGMADLPNKILFKPAAGPPLDQLFPKASADCLDLLRQLMHFDPDKRITAAAALQHPYFSNHPAPTPPTSLPRPTTTRSNRRCAATVPALVQEMLLRPDVLVRMQQQTAAPGVSSGSGRNLFPASNGVSFSGRFLQGPNLQQHTAVPESLLGDGKTRLARGQSGVLEGHTGEQQQQGFGILGRSLSGVSVFSDDTAGSNPLKCRLSFGSVYDEPLAAASLQEQPSRPSSVEVGQEASTRTISAATDVKQQQQHQGLRRPSPMAISSQLQGNSKGSMRPPLHPTGSMHAGVTPVSSRPGSAGVSDGQTQSVAVAGAKRKVSDLIAALLGAAAGPTGTAPVAVGAALAEPMMCQINSHNSISSTPAVDDPRSRLQIPPAEGSDITCPINSDVSAHKRSRAEYESMIAPAADADHRQQPPQDALQLHEQQEQGAGPMSIGRRVLRGRRSSMGCCSMDTDVDELQRPQQQQPQHSVVGLMLPPAAHANHHNHSTTKHARFCSSAVGHLEARQQAAASHEAADVKQLQLEALLGGNDSSSTQRQGGSSSRGALQLLQPWQHAAVAAGPSCSNAALVHNAAGSVFLPDCPKSLEQLQWAAPGGHRTQFTAPNTGGHSDLATGAESVGPCTSQRLGCLIGGLHDGLPTVDNGDDVTPGFGLTEEELAAIDPLQLAEWANQWKPIVPSAEKRYLKERKLLMDEALLQASQPDSHNTPDKTQSPEYMHHSSKQGSAATTTAAADGSSMEGLAGMSRLDSCESVGHGIQQQQQQHVAAEAAA